MIGLEKLRHLAEGNNHLFETMSHLVEENESSIWIKKPPESRFVWMNHIKIALHFVVFQVYCRLPKQFPMRV